MNQTLLLYLSREGQTRKIADCIAAELQQAGQRVVVAELTTVSAEVLAAAGALELADCPIPDADAST